MSLRPSWNDMNENENRFWSKVDKSGLCWLWTGARRTKGYGAYWHGGRLVQAHRFSFEIAYGAIELGKFVCHTCDVKLCVNPAHLYQGTNSENILDASAKGLLRGRRTALGEAHGSSKLTLEQVRKIRSMYIPRKCGAKQIAKQFPGVSTEAIRQVITGKTWREALAVIEGE
jgi:HNH endonuclease